jgi:hypothetical protein
LKDYMNIRTKDLWINKEVINNLDALCQIKLCLGQIIIILLSKYI